MAFLQQPISQLSKRKRKNAKLPVVISVLVYRGSKRPYPPATEIMDCFQNPALVRKVLLSPLSLVDLSIIPDEELKTHNSVALLELVQKPIHARDHAYQFKEWIEKNRLHSYLALVQFAMAIEYELGVNCS